MCYFTALFLIREVLPCCKSGSRLFVLLEGGLCFFVAIVPCSISMQTFYIEINRCQDIIFT